MEGQDKENILERLKNSSNVVFDNWFYLISPAVYLKPARHGMEKYLQNLPPAGEFFLSKDIDILNIKLYING